jgi:hypothetical protein
MMNGFIFFQFGRQLRTFDASATADYSPADWDARMRLGTATMAIGWRRAPDAEG